jgi:hypothetical protein
VLGIAKGSLTISSDCALTMAKAAQRFFLPLMVGGGLYCIYVIEIKGFSSESV